MPPKAPEPQPIDTTPTEVVNSDWPKKFRETFDLWQRLNPNLYKDFVTVDQ